jgi:hypothetical protein
MMSHHPLAGDLRLTGMIARGIDHYLQDVQLQAQQPTSGWLPGDIFQTNGHGGARGKGAGCDVDAAQNARNNRQG